MLGPFKLSVQVVTHHTDAAFCGQHLFGQALECRALPSSVHAQQRKALPELQPKRQGLYCFDWRTAAMLYLAEVFRNTPHNDLVRTLDHTFLFAHHIAVNPPVV